MKVLAFFLMTLAVSHAWVAKIKPKSPNVEMCNDVTSSWVNNIVLNVTPWPIHVATGETITLDGGFDLLQTVPEGAKVALNLRALGIIDIDIPCLEVSVV